MSITNYWFQLIWLLTVGMVLAISLPKKQENRYGKDRRKMADSTRQCF